MFIDSHCHLDASEFDEDREQLLAAAVARGVQRIVVPAVGRINFDAVQALAARHSEVYYTLGIHPLFVPQAHEEDLAYLADRLPLELLDPKFVGIGEIGLDYFVPELCTEAMRTKQQHFYNAQLQLAAEHQLPVIVHVRRAVDDTLKYIRRYVDLTGIAHAFNGSNQQAEQYIDRGFKLGIGGAMTFTRAKQIRRLASQLPLDALVLETDAPDIPPAWLGQPGQNPRNTPGELPQIADELARLRKTSLEEIARQTTLNVRQVLGRLG